MGVLRKATVKESVKITDSNSNKDSDSNDYTVDQFWRDVYSHAAWKCSREKNHCLCVVVAECDRVKSSNAKMTMSSRLLEEQ